MNLWKPLALLSTTALVLTLGYQAASANPATQTADIAGNQPNMDAALGKLVEARAFLDRAEHNKGGWRTKAIESADVAIRETRRGIGYADTH